MSALDAGFVIALTVPALCATAAIAIRRQCGYWRTLGLLAIVAYVGCVMALTLFPVPIDPLYIQDLKQLGYRENNLVPFASILGALANSPRIFAIQVVGNSLLLLPLGLLLPALSRSAREIRRGLLWILAAALTIEATQFLISTAIGFTYRSADIDDMILNTLGGFAGYGFFHLTHRARRRRLSSVISPAHPDHAEIAETLR